VGRQLRRIDARAAHRVLDLRMASGARAIRWHAVHPPALLQAMGVLGIESRHASNTRICGYRCAFPQEFVEDLPQVLVAAGSEAERIELVDDEDAAGTMRETGEDHGG